ncbi:hypothetical protein PMAYCL1PPCAC_30307, partial [Pristionchus mayeri]
SYFSVFDSNGKRGSAILRGHAYFAGHYSECTKIDYQMENRERKFKGQYFRVDIDPFFRPNSRNDSCSVVLLVMTGIEIFWEFGVCLPASCSSAEMRNLFRPAKGSSIDNPVCQFKRPGDITPNLDAGFYITLVIMGVIVAICIASGFVDFYFSERLNNTAFSKSLGWKFFMSCSLYTNISSIYDTSESSKSSQIGPIHCIRFFSMVWVLMSHLFSSWLAIVANGDDIMALGRDLTSEVILNGFFSVDSFFFMSGVLLTFLWFKSFHRQPKETMSVYGWAMFYIHRFLRLSPAYYILIIFYTFVVKQMIRETPLSMNSIVTADSCSDTWWVEMLYLHNYVDHQRPCLGYSWYLAADMQMYLFTPLLIIPLAFKPILGFIVAAIVFIISTATNIFLVYHYHWPAGQNWFHPPDPQQTNFENYNMLMYDSPLIRCQIVYITAWVVAISLMLTVLLGLHDQTNGTELGIFWRAMYSAFNRPAWGIGLSTIVILCYYGYGGPINSFMSWHIWVPLGRLCYSGYLIHIPMIQLTLSQTKDEIYFSNFIDFLITRVISITAVTFFFAIFWSACFELSFGRIEKLLIGGVRTPKSIEKVTIVKGEEAVWGADVEGEIKL